MPRAPACTGRFLILEEDRLARERIQQSDAGVPCRRSSQVSYGARTLHFERGRASILSRTKWGELTRSVRPRPRACGRGPAGAQSGISDRDGLLDMQRARGIAHNRKREG